MRRNHVGRCHIGIGDKLVVRVEGDVGIGIGRPGRPVAIRIDIGVQPVRPQFERMAAVEIVLQRQPPIGHHTFDPRRAGYRHDTSRVQHIPAQATVQREFGVDPIAPQRVGTRPDDSLPQLTIDHRRRHRPRRKPGTVVRKAPNRRGVPQIGHARAVGQGETVDAVDLERREFGGIANIHVIDVGHACHTVVRRLHEGAEIGRDAAGVVDRYLIHREIIVRREPTRRPARLRRLRVCERRLNRHRDRRFPGLSVRRRVAAEFEIPPIRP